MKNELERRAFLKKTIALGAMTIVGTILPRSIKAAMLTENVDIAIVEGVDYFSNTIKAVELLGGMGKFVSRGSKVGLLINAPTWWNKPGSFTNPDVVLATIKMCYEAGASEIVYIIDPANDYWKRSKKSDEYIKEISQVKKNPGIWVDKVIPAGKVLNKAQMNKSLFECDVLIDLPVAKHHAGTGFTGNLKNMMGANHRTTNQFFHQGSGAAGAYDDVTFLSKCIADINLVRKPDLSICDATEFLITNGPAGPGEIKKAQTVVAGADVVAVDAYCCTLHGLKAEDVMMIRFAHDHGIGQMDISKMVVKKQMA